MISQIIHCARVSGMSHSFRDTKYHSDLSENGCCGSHKINPWCRGPSLSSLSFSWYSPVNGAAFIKMLQTNQRSFFLRNFKHWKISGLSLFYFFFFYLWSWSRDGHYQFWVILQNYHWEIIIVVHVTDQIVVFLPTRKCKVLANC